jgi:hypothetical protein
MMKEYIKYAVVFTKLAEMIEKNQKVGIKEITPLVQQLDIEEKIKIITLLVFCVNKGGDLFQLLKESLEYKKKYVALLEQNTEKERHKHFQHLISLYNIEYKVNKENYIVYFEHEDSEDPDNNSVMYCHDILGSEEAYKTLVKFIDELNEK